MNRIIVLLFLVNFFVNAQNSGYIEGIVVEDKNNSVEGVHVFNKTTLKGTITNADGFFKINVKEQDTILFSSISYKMKEIIVTDSMINRKGIIIQMISTIYELDEVVVNPYGNLSGFLEHDIKQQLNQNIITASSLGLPNANTPKMSYSERKIYSLTNHDGVLFALINKISGRTKKNNKIKAIIRKQDTIEKVRSSFHDSLFVYSLKIPQNQIDGFIYYCEVDSSFQKTIELENKLVLWDFLLRKSVEYNNIINKGSNK